jgi:hypothetical protein
VDINPKIGYITLMEYKVVVSRKILRNLSKLPVDVQDKFIVLTSVLRHAGPAGPHKWRNYSKLGKDKYHCHLNYRYVACWYCEYGSITVEVYYAGSREEAPY